MENARLQSQSGKALRLHIFLDASFYVGQELTQGFPAFAPCRERLIAREQQAEIIAQSAIDGFLEVDRQHIRRGLAFRFAAQERALGSRKRNRRSLP